MKNLILVLFTVCSWIVVPCNLDADVSNVITNTQIDNYVNNVEKEHKTNLKEKVVLKILQSKYKKQLNKEDNTKNVKTRDLAVLGFLAGVLGLIAFLALLGTGSVGLFIAWLALCVISIVLSGTALKRIKKDPESNKKSGKGWAIAGLIIAIAPVVLAIVVIVAYLTSY